MPSAILRRHDLDRFAPVTQFSRWPLGLTPPQPGFRRHLTVAHPDPRKDSLKSVIPLTNAEIEHLHFRCCKHGVFAPACAPVFTLSVAMNQVILMVGTGDLPHLPPAVVIHQVGFIYAPPFPIFVRDEGGFRLILPSSPIPLKKPDGVWSPEILRPTCIVNALYPSCFVGVPTLHVGRAVPSSVAVP